MDPRLEGQYSTEGARKVAALAYQCLSHQAKSRPTMRTVVKTLEPLMDLTDFPVGHFVYIVPTEAENETSTKSNFKVVENDHHKQSRREKKSEQEEENCEKKNKGRKWLRRSHRYRRQIKLLRNRAVYSDTALYKTLGTSLYSPKQGSEKGVGISMT
ncbi:hypothetical protein L6164_004201 [Bauhinia variegata]|nr:hypothetical protein L6164_004201 [Bauhinia variegata]